ncbi:MAG: hypothetical protein ABWX90_00600 [Candidatus Saccharimonadales bacterium]
MYKSSSSRVVPIVIVLIIIAVAIAVMVSVGRAIFGGNTGTNTSKVDLGVESLLNTSVDRSVRMTVRGPIVADENFRSYQIAVDSSSRRMTTYAGYLDTTLQNVQLDNNAKGYEEFVNALNRAQLMKGEEGNVEQNDTLGVCATGRVYEFEVLQGTSVIKRLWTSTCKGAAGTLKANRAQVEDLFNAQIPNSQEILNTIDI